MRYRVTSLWLLPLMYLVTVTSVQAQLPSQVLIDGSDPQLILNIAKGYGSATLSRDAVGDPRIEGVIDGNHYQIVFYNCRHGERCDLLLFQAAWASRYFDLEMVNRWNREKIYGQLYLDIDNDPVVEMPVNLAHGVTRRNLEKSFDYWRIVLFTLVDEMMR